MKKPLWTVQETEILLKMAKAKRTVSEIAQVLKSRTKDAIRCKAATEGIIISDAPDPEIDMQKFNELMGEKWKRRVVG